MRRRVRGDFVESTKSRSGEEDGAEDPDAPADDATDKPPNPPPPPAPAVADGGEADKADEEAMLETEAAPPIRLGGDGRKQLSVH